MQLTNDRIADAPRIEVLRHVSNGWFKACRRAAPPKLDVPQWADFSPSSQGARLLNLPFASHTVLEDSPEDVLPGFRSFIASLAEPKQS